MSPETAGPLPYELWAHADQVMTERSISRDWLERTLAEPDTVEPDARDRRLVHHLRVFPEYGGRVLRVVVTASASPRRVVAMFFDRRKGKST